MESGHGLRGRKIWMCGDGDVEMMYDYFKKSKSILWCATQKLILRLQRKIK